MPVEQLVAAKREQVAQHADMEALENFKEVDEATREQGNPAPAKKKREKRQVVVQVQQKITRRSNRVRQQVQCASYTLLV